MELYHEISQLSNTLAARFCAGRTAVLRDRIPLKALLSVSSHIFVCSTVLEDLCLAMGRSPVQTSRRIPKSQKLINEWKLETRSKNISRDSPCYFHFCWKTIN